MAASRCYIASAQDSGKRLDSLLAELGFYKSRSAAVKAIESGLVLVGGRASTKKYAVQQGDAIVYTIDEEEVETPLRGEEIPLDIRYEDSHLLVISKQAGLVCHPSHNHDSGSLVNALIYHCGLSNLCNVQGEADRLGIVHRLDMDTSGLMLAAKDDETCYALMEAIQDRAVDRHYLALVHGIIPGDTGLVDAPIARHPVERTRMAINDGPSARDAVTTFTVVERFEAMHKDNGYTLIDCKLFTGRTHQIRVHMEYAAHPLVGDPMYTAHAPKSPDAQLGLWRQFLHSYRLNFEHPVTGETMKFLDNLPDDLRDSYSLLKERSYGLTDYGKELFAQLEDAPYPSVVA